MVEIPKYLQVNLASTSQINDGIAGEQCISCPCNLVPLCCRADSSPLQDHSVWEGVNKWREMILTALILKLLEHLFWVESILAGLEEKLCNVDHYSGPLRLIHLPPCEMRPCVCCSWVLEKELTAWAPLLGSCRFLKPWDIQMCPKIAVSGRSGQGE